MKKIYRLIICVTLLNLFLFICALNNNIFAMSIFVAIALIYMSGSLTYQFKGTWIYTYIAYILVFTSSIYLIIHQSLYGYKNISFIIPIACVLITSLIYLLILKNKEYKEKEYINLITDLSSTTQGLPVFFMALLVVALSQIIHPILNLIYLDKKANLVLIFLGSILSVYSVISIIKSNLRYITMNILNVRINNPKNFIMINLIPIFLWIIIITALSFILSVKNNVVDITPLIYLGYLPYILNIRLINQKYFYNQNIFKNLNLINDDFLYTKTESRNLDNVIDIDVEDKT